MSPDDTVHLFYGSDIEISTLVVDIEDEETLNRTILDWKKTLNFLDMAATVDLSESQHQEEAVFDPIERQTKSYSYQISFPTKAVERCAARLEDARLRARQLHSVKERNRQRMARIRVTDQTEKEQVPVNE
uniref:Uncharacterized protein n=1 Tax=Onchocerca volvulus TaxID=6282 RepID=A0A8R1TM01_ONCVO